MGKGGASKRMKQTSQLTYLRQGESIQLFQPPSEVFCEYCASLVVGIRCESCGAPIRQKRGTYRDEWPPVFLGFPMCLHPDIEIPS